jgi:Hemopexin
MSFECYFFSGSEYIGVTRDATGAGFIAAGYPAPISDWGWGSFGEDGIDAALYSGLKWYFFSGNEYIRVSRPETDPVPRKDLGTVDPGYPAPISEWGWGSFGEDGIDAALYSQTKCYFFAGPSYIRVTRGETGAGEVDAGYPTTIASSWGWGSFGANGISAALYSGQTVSDSSPGGPPGPSGPPSGD